MAINVAVDGAFLLKWCEYFGQPQVWYMRKLCAMASCGTSVMYIAQFELLRSEM